MSKLILFIIAYCFSLNSAFFINKNSEDLTDKNRVEIYKLLTESRQIDEESLNNKLNHYNVRARWIPDTLYQLLQLGYFEKKDKEIILPVGVQVSNKFFDKDNRFNKRDEVFTSADANFYRFNNKVLFAKLCDKKTNALLEIAFAKIKNNTDLDDKLSKHKKYLTENLNSRVLFARIIAEEENAHRENAMLLWRFTSAVEIRKPSENRGDGAPFLDLAIDIPLFENTKEIKLYQKTGLSYAYTVLAGIINDSMINETIRSEGGAACTLAYLIHNELADQGLKNILSSLYYIKLSQKDLQLSHNIADHFVYLPAFSFDQDIFGKGELFHPRWYLMRKESDLASGMVKKEEDEFICDHSKRMTDAQILYTDSDFLQPSENSKMLIKNHQHLLDMLIKKGICTKLQ